MTSSRRDSLNVAATSRERHPGVNCDVVRMFSPLYEVTFSRRSSRRLKDVTETFAQSRWNVNMFSGYNPNPNPNPNPNFAS